MEKVIKKSFNFFFKIITQLLFSVAKIKIKKLTLYRCGHATWKFHPVRCYVVHSRGKARNLEIARG
jgi:hypothetical protein